MRLLPALFHSLCRAFTELWQEWKVCEFKQTILIAAAQAFLSHLIYYQQQINAGEVRRSAATEKKEEREREIFQATQQNCQECVNMLVCCFLFIFLQLLPLLNLSY